MDVQYLENTPLMRRADYVKDLRGDLPAAAFEPVRSPLARVPLLMAAITVGILAIARGWVPWPVVPAVSIGLGLAFSGLTFIAHEVLHGGISRSKLVQRVVGWIGFSLFTVSPLLWIGWHNRDHHANTGHADDPDAYASLEAYRAKKSTRFSVDMFSLGGKRWRGALSLILGFTVQSADQLLGARQRGTLTKRQLVIAIAETGAGVAMWATIAVLVGFVPFLFIYLLPLLVANACVMAFILTNHSLSPRTEINDPLINSLSVTTSRLTDWLTLNFGMHVEHHLFPAMSSRYAPAVRAAVRTRWPERYQELPLHVALHRLYATGRVYKDAVTLYDPLTDRTFPTLRPGVHPDPGHRPASALAGSWPAFVSAALSTPRSPSGTDL